MNLPVPLVLIPACPIRIPLWKRTQRKQGKETDTPLMTEVRDSILSHKQLEYPTEQMGGFREKLQEKERIGMYESVASSTR